MTDITLFNEIAILKYLEVCLWSMWSISAFLYTVPSAVPKNLTFQLTEQQLSLTWAALSEEELNGKLLAYKVQWNVGGESQVHLLSISKSHDFK